MILQAARSTKQLKSPQRWNQLPSGRHLLQELNGLLKPHLQKVFGYHLLKVGALSQQVDTSSSPIKHQFTLSPKHGLGELQSELSALALREHSIDCVVLSHVLDFSQDPHQVIREVNRVLIANGHFIYVGLNPFSLAGIRRLWSSRSSNLVWQARFFSSYRVKDWMNLLGLEVLEEQYFAHAGLYKSKFWFLDNWNRFAGKYFPWSGSMYFVIAKKRELPLSLIKPKWTLTPQLSPAKVSLCSRNQNITG